MQDSTFARALPDIRGARWTRRPPGLSAGPAATYAWADEQSAALIAARNLAGETNRCQAVSTIACPECAGRGYTGAGATWADACDNPGCRLGRIPAGAFGATVCPVCRGDQVVRRGLPIGHPDFGRPIPCECTRGPLPVTREVSAVQLGAAGMPVKYHRMTLETWRAEVFPGQGLSYSTAYDLARALIGGSIAERSQGRAGLLLMGRQGRGKSGLAAGVFAAFMARAVSARWVPWGSYCDRLNDLRNRGESDRDTLARDIAAHVLVIDDLGSQGAATDFRIRILKEILEARAGRPTVITTMQTFEALSAQFGDHNVGRLIEDYAPVTLDGRDLRMSREEHDHA